ncbi:MAG: hypothetical protein U0Q11_22160 [Vicinamibacterales bacterium]
MFNSCARVVALSGTITLMSAALVSAQPASTPGGTTSTGEPRMSLGITFGADGVFSGDIVSSSVGTLAGLPATVSTLSYNDVYGTPFMWSIEFGYLWTDNDEAHIRLAHAGASSERRQVGSVGAFSLFGDFDQYASLGVELGYRRYLNNISEHVQPFAGGDIGLHHIDPISVTLTAPATTLTLPQIPLYDGSNVFSFSVSAGARVPITERFAVLGTIALRGQGGLSDQNSLAGTGLSTATDNTARWSLPLTVSAVYRF